MLPKKRRNYRAKNVKWYLESRFLGSGHEKQGIKTKVQFIDLRKEERIINVINENGNREDRLLFAVSVARNNDRSGVHYNYVDGDGHTYTNKTVAGSVRVVDDRYKGNIAETDTGSHQNTKHTFACMANLGSIKDKTAREELSKWLKSYKRVTRMNGAVVYCDDANMYTCNAIARHTIDNGLECMTLFIDGEKYKVTKELRSVWNQSVNNLYRYLGV